MADRPLPFPEFLKEEINRTKGVYYPVRAGFLRRILIKETATKNLHPNPEDEFCFPNIGPNYEIVSKYERQFRQGAYSEINKLGESTAAEPLMVQRARPDGYMLLNGHHRWGGAYKAGISRMRIKIVNLTQEKDIKKMLQSSQSDKRVTLDLDEVVFRNPEDGCVEKPLPFPMNRHFKERIRLGVPALFRYLNDHSYDIWVYTSNYYSMEYIRYMFKHRGVRLTGIVTGTGRKGAKVGASVDLKKMMEDQYKSTIHIDNDLILRTFSGSKEHDEVALSGAPETWSREVLDALQKMAQKDS